MGSARQKVIAALARRDRLLLLCCAVVAAFFFGVFYHPRSPLPLSDCSATVEVTVAGAVAAPGVVLVPKEATVECLLNQVELSDDADLSRMNMARRLRSGSVVTIPKRKRVTLYLQGNPEVAGAVQFEVGATGAELRAHPRLRGVSSAILPPKEDLLKDQQVVWIGPSSDTPPSFAENLLH